MIFSEFVSYYPQYTVETLLQLPYRTFKALFASMKRLKALDDLNNIYIGRFAQAPKESLAEVTRALKAEALGSEDLVRQAKLLKEIKQ